MSITRDIKYALKGSNGALIRLLIINVSVCLLVNIISSVMALNGVRFSEDVLVNYLALPNDLELLPYRFWTIITYMFLHTGLMHLLGNMLMLWFLGRVFSDLLGGARMTMVYIIGGICGGILYILVENLLPQFHYGNLQGASAGVMAIVVAAAAYSPDYLVFPFGQQMKLKWLALIAFVLTSLIDLTANTGGKVSHIGGAVFGFIYGTQLRQGRNFMEKFSGIFKRKSKLRVEYTRAQRVDDQAYNERKISIRKQVDEILDKISRSGYDSLNKDEKEFLQKNHDKF